MNAALDVRTALAPLLDADLTRWRGLQPLSRTALEAAFGAPTTVEEADLGHVPALRLRYDSDRPRFTDSPRFTAWERDGAIVMIEADRMPAVDMLARLPTPDARLQHEILLDGAYAREYLYCAIGLVLTVAEPFDRSGPNAIVRARGIAPLADPSGFGPAYYLPFADQVRWAPPEGMGA
jgi:hypothetical protein